MTEKTSGVSSRLQADILLEGVDLGDAPSGCVLDWIRDNPRRAGQILGFKVGLLVVERYNAEKFFGVETDIIDQIALTAYTFVKYDGSRTRQLHEGFKSGQSLAGIDKTGPMTGYNRTRVDSLEDDWEMLTGAPEFEIQHSSKAGVVK